jgi:dipeptidyl aminopeptidase/acylaminoacyl peptidase
MLVDSQVSLTYQVPHDDIRKLADVDLAPGIRMNADATYAVLLYRSNFKSIEEMSEPELRLAGLRINPKTNIGSRTYYYNNIKWFDIQTGKIKHVSGLPETPKIANVSWSPDQSKIGFTHTTSNGVQLYVLEMQTQVCQLLTEDNLNDNMGLSFSWMKDSKHLLISKLPEDRQALIDSKAEVPKGPTISVNDGGTKAQNRTYQDLLKNPADEHNFKQLARAELWKVALDGSTEKWLPADLYSDIRISPDGSYVMVEKIHEPFSYLVPYYRFPSTISMYDKSGKFIHEVHEMPLMEELPKGFMAVQEGPRSINWRPDKPATLYWAEALDKGDPAADVDYRDEIKMREVPFNAPARTIFKTPYRYRGMDWANDKLAVCYSYWWNTRMTRTDIFNPSDPQSESFVFDNRNYQDRYSDPGTFVTKRNEYGRQVLEQDNGQLYLLGSGYSEEGVFPFIDRYSLKDHKVKRLYQAEEEDKLERIVSSIDMKNGVVMVRLESPNEFPNYYIRNIKTDQLMQITFFENPFESIQNVHKELITYERSDGVELSATLYLPVGYDETKKEKFPMLMWAYPVEYKDKSSAGQLTNSPNEFTYPWYGSPIFWVNRGYVVLDDAAFPIIGEGDAEPNDSFRKQLVDNAKSAIDAVDEMGYIDRNRVAVGGHSYGAFMTANLLSHSNLFAAGIARSGAYNRTLTPFGFQSEERNYWEAPEIYYEMSPFMHADKMKTPLLLLHGEADNNSGTYPMQSERYFNALKGLGATVRLVMLPKESHGYSAKESIMHMLWEQDQWLEKYVKNRDVEEIQKP